MCDESEITHKIRETKRQTEALKTQLQNLIDKGKNLVCPSQSKVELSTSAKEEKEPLESPNRVQIIKSYETKHSKPIQEPHNIPAKTKADSSKKPKAYDIKETREYMKKQKERRIEQSKAQNDAKLKHELQKKKLQELHKKSLELLAKNVQAKRERSKSRDRNTYIRPDNPSNLASNLRKVKSMDKLHHKEPPAASVKNPNLLYPPSPDFVKRMKQNAPAKKAEVPKVESEKIVILARNFTRQGVKQAEATKEPVDIQSRQKLSTQLEQHSAKITQEDSNQNRHLNERITDTILSKPNNKYKNLDIPGLECLKPRKLFTADGAENASVDFAVKHTELAVKNILEYKSPNLNVSNVTTRPSVEDKKISHDLGAKPKDITPLSTTIKPPEETRKHSKEIQTETVHKEFPKWLEEQPPQAYPFNFMNTITRKLHEVTNRHKDIGIQNSIVSPKVHEKVEVVASGKNHENSKLRSFISHKCLNLDPVAIEHLELIPKNNYDVLKRISHRSTQITETGSESDTSKNIPEISSESGTSLKKNKESVRKVLLSDNYVINTDKIDSMKLVPHSKSDTTIKSDSQIPTETNLTKQKKLGDYSTKEKKITDHLTVENAYGSDFESDISNEENLNRSRRSIISFNRSPYNKVSHDPGNDEVTSKSQISHQKTVSSVNTEMILSKDSRLAEKTDSKASSLQKSTSEKYNTSSNHSKGTLQHDQESLDTPKPESTISSISKVSLDSVKHTDNIKIITSSKNSSGSTESVLTNLSHQSLKNVNVKRGSSRIEEEKSEVLPLTEPKVSLIQSSEVGKSNGGEGTTRLVKNLSVQSSKMSTKANMNEPNQIHLKFEAEIHLLNDFNESLKKFSALEQALETLKNKNTVAASKLLQNNAAQTSVIANTSTISTRPKEKASKVETSRSSPSHTSHINFSRGSFINTIDDDLNLLKDTTVDKDKSSILSTGLEISNLNSINQSLSAKSEDHFSNFENLQTINFAGLSLNMFEQLIKDEDVRLENLKTILKIREQALLDRTKGELAWLEIQRKHFKETGKLHEASVVKKKQRGILVNHQKEKHEMQRLKQMQRAASIERKIVLKEQRNLIRQQLSTDNMMSKMKVHSSRERRLSGPLKVLQSHTEFIRSETSVTKRSSSDKEKHSDVFSITSHQSMTHSVVSEISEVEASSKDLPSREQQKHIKRTLLMREEALKKRRKAAEELLQWHKKLLEEEKRIAVLESTASAIISQKPSSSKSQEKFHFKGKQLNQLWLNLTGIEEKKFTDDKIYPMSQLDLEHFCKSARGYSIRTKSLFKKTSDNLSESENIPTQPTTEKDYLSDFEKESMPLTEVDGVDQSIDILINNFNQIQDDISTLNIIHSRKSDESLAEDIVSDKFDRTDSEAGISVIETNRTRSMTAPKKLITASAEAVEENVPSLEKSRESTSEKITSLEKDTEMIPSLEEINLDEKNSRSISEESSKLKPSSILSEQFKTHISKHSANKNEEVITQSDTTKLSTDPDLSKHVTRSVELKNLANKEAVEQQITENIPENISLVTENADVSNVNVPVAADSRETLNQSQQILELLGEPEVKTIPEDCSANVQLKDSLTESEEILSKLSQIINELEDTGDQVIKSVEISEDSSQKSKSDDREISIRAVEDFMPGNEEIISHSSEVKSVIDEDQSKSQLSTSKSEENIKYQLSTSETEENEGNTSSVKSNDFKHEEDSAGSKVSRLSDVIISKTQEDNISPLSGSVEDVISATEENEEITGSKVEESSIGSKANRSSEVIASKTAEDNSEVRSSISSAPLRSKSEDKSDTKLKATVEFKKPSIEEYISKTKSTISSEQSRASLDLNSQNEDDTKLTGSPIQSNSSLSQSIEDGLSQSLKKLIEISKSDIPSVKDSGSLSKESESDVLQDISALEDFIKSELEHTESESCAKVEASELERVESEKSELERAKLEDNELKRAESEVSELELSEEQTSEIELDENKVNVEDEVINLELAKTEVSYLERAKIEVRDLERAKTEVSDLEFAEIELSDLDHAKTEMSGLECAETEVSDLERVKNVSIEEILKVNKDSSVVETGDVSVNVNVVQTFENVVDEVEDNYKALDDAIGDESDDSKVALSDKSNESFIVNDISDELSQNQEDPIEESEKLSKELEAKEVTEKSDKDCSITEDFEEETTSKSSHVISNLSYGLIGKARSDSDSSVATSKEEVCYEEKEHDSLSSITGGSSSDVSELVVLSKDQKAMKNKKNIEDLRVKSKSQSDAENSSPKMNVKKRVSEILADASLSRGDKSPRLQDLYVTTYDLISPANSPERAPSSPVEENKLVSSIFVSEAEEILRKQLAVEEEMKAITEQLQKEQMPVMYIREIPNKPPPPYTPPTSLTQPSVPTIIPTSEEIEEITMYSAKILHKAYLSKNLVNVNISNNTLSLISKNISKDCYKFVFDLCKDIARKHYSQFEEDRSPSWLRVPKKADFSPVKPFDTESLKLHMIQQLKEIFGYQKPPKTESVNIKWNRKKSDHLYDILVLECQQEEAQFTNYQKDELLVKDQITNEIFDSLLKDTASVLARLLLKGN
ncbi:uncharacterized protein [Diabrotica undecimpunctata]|uniref:uncharacterized protein n=1 Tax=Diabrotica undecimpunctata TaxID=50387 RepID=UPI003B63753A